MAAIWKTKVLPKIKKIFSSDKKKAALQAKLFDKEKESIDKQTEEKKEELSPKLLELFEAADPETKALLQSPSEAAVKEKTEAVAKLLKDLADKGFPGASFLNEAVAKVGVASLAGPITWLLKKVSTFLPPAPTPPPAESKEVEVADKAVPAAASDKPEEDVAVTANVQNVIQTTTAEAAAPPPATETPPPAAAAPAPAPEPAITEVTPAPAPAAAPSEPPPAPAAAPAT